MSTLSKSKLLAYRQCAKRLWLGVHHPELREESSQNSTRLDAGLQVGEIARKLYDSDARGQLIDLNAIGIAEAFKRCQTLLTSPQPIFEAAFTSDDVLCFADMLLPASSGEAKKWRMVEVKSSTSVKDYHIDDASIQTHIALGAGIPLAKVAVAHIDSTWTYPGDGDYDGLLTEVDVTDEVYALAADVKSWIAGAKATVKLKSAPDIPPGRHCASPFPCEFHEHCAAQGPVPEFPVSWLPNIRTKALKAKIEEDGIIDMRDVPDDLLNDRQARVKSHTLKGTTFFDAAGAAADLAAHALPAYFLDFETINLAVPIWAGTRPYQQVPFQYSLHLLGPQEQLDHFAFLDLSGSDPSRPFAEQLVRECGTRGPVFVYNASFESARLKELAKRFADLADSLLAIVGRIVDLLPIAENRYYHPSQKGSWSIKAVLPAIAPDLRYDALLGVQDGGMAMAAFAEAIHPSTSQERKLEIEHELLAYCGLDTYAMVRLWCEFSGRKDVPAPNYVKSV